MRILLLNQCFYPDHVSTAQHLTDLALALAEQKHQVTVLTGRRGYDDPAQRFKGRETWRGIDVIRIPTLGLGKSARWRRVLNFASFLILCFLRLMVLPRQDLTVALTSPPLISLLAALFVQVRGGRLCSWVMDLNPDEGVALGWLREDALVTQFLQSLLKHSLQHSDKIIVLDRFMRQRIVLKGIPDERLVVIPPWSHDDDVRYDEEGRKSFRTTHGLIDKFVVMYSGNHSPCHPLNTLLKAALSLQSQTAIMFCFVGGGSEFEKVKTFARANCLSNVLCLPYQPRDQLSASLSAADLHVVVMGDLVRGLVHPCKVYNIIGIGVPLLYIGPAESHISDLVQQHPVGISMRDSRHGGVDEVVAHIRAAAATGPLRIKEARDVSRYFSSQTMLPIMISVLESTVEGGKRKTVTIPQIQTSD